MAAFLLAEDLSDFVFTPFSPDFIEAVDGELELPDVIAPLLVCAKAGVESSASDNMPANAICRMQGSPLEMF